MQALGQWLAVALLRMLVMITRIFPYRLRIALGGKIIAFILRLIPETRRRTFHNIEKIHPQWNNAQKTRLYKNMLANFGQNMMELYNLKSFGERLDRFHASGDGYSLLCELIEKKKPAIIVSGHFGQWEAIRAICRHKGAPLASIYKENSNPYYERYFTKSLEISGPLFPTGTSGMVSLIRYLRAGGMVSLLHDQRVNSAPILDFLGEPAHSSLATAEMAVKYQVPLIPAYAIRRENGYDYDVVFEAPIELSDPKEMTQAMNNSLSSKVSAHPEQWYWLHDRWLLKNKKT